MSSVYVHMWTEHVHLNLIPYTFKLPENNEPAKAYSNNSSAQTIIERE